MSETAAMGQESDASGEIVAHQTSPDVPSEDAADVVAGPVASSESPTPSPPAPEGNASSGGGTQETFNDSLRRILRVPRARGSVPTLVRYKEGVFQRYFILDVDGDVFRKAWSHYKANAADPNPVAFVHLVINILETDFPRMYRAVAYVPLD